MGEVVQEQETRHALAALCYRVRRLLPEEPLYLGCQEVVWQGKW
jgi:hypothetical protein